MKKILIDGRISINDGIGRYTREMIKAMGASSYYSIFCLVRNKDFVNHPFEIYEDSSQSYSMKEIVNLDETVKKSRPDIVHCFDYRSPLHMGRAKLIITIHDIFRFIDKTLCYSDEDFQKKIGKNLVKECEIILSLYDKPNNYMKNVDYNSLHRQYYCYLLSHAINAADYLIVPSHVVKNDILNNFLVSANKIRVIYHGLDHINTNNKINLSVKNNFFLYVGQNRPHKNCDLLVRSFRQYMKNNPSSMQLLLVGKDFHKERILGENIICMGEKNDQELIYLLENATALIHIPQFEGFGFTPAEALCCNCPVIASDIPVLREILGASAMFIEIGNTQELVKAFEKVQENPINFPFLLRHRKWTHTIQEVYNLYNAV